ncbi:MAG: hypothetical protein HBSAPP03_19940 [Phycisphaerae bacterium]|nr:MAG: hypothetical protein HBSAPP03_19940 [Phycisphaerae bacterium]
MLHLRHLEDLRRLLLELPDLTRRRDRADVPFHDLVLAWLARVEDSLIAGRLHHAGTIAALRDLIADAGAGGVPRGVVVAGPMSRRKLRAAAASFALREGTDLLAALIDQHTPRLDEAERVARQIVAALMSAGLTPTRSAYPDTTSYLATVRRVLSSRADLEAAAIHLEGLVDRYDALLLLDRAMAPYEHAAATPVGPGGTP